MTNLQSASLLNINPQICVIVTLFATQEIGLMIKGHFFTVTSIIQVFKIGGQVCKRVTFHDKQVFVPSRIIVSSLLLKSISNLKKYCNSDELYEYNTYFITSIFWYFDIAIFQFLSIEFIQRVKSGNCSQNAVFTLEVNVQFLLLF